MASERSDGIFSQIGSKKGIFCLNHITFTSFNRRTNNFWLIQIQRIAFTTKFIFLLEKDTMQYETNLFSFEGNLILRIKNKQSILKIITIVLFVFKINRIYNDNFNWYQNYKRNFNSNKIILVISNMIIIWLKKQVSHNFFLDF